MDPESQSQPGQPGQPSEPPRRSGSAIGPDPGNVLRFRAPGRAIEVVELLGRALPDAELDDLVERVRSGGVTVDGARLRRLDGSVAAGAKVVVEVAAADLEDWRSDIATSLAGHHGLRALVLVPEWPSGELEAPGGAIRFELAETHGAVAELRIERAIESIESVESVEEGARVLDPIELLGLLAGLGHPVIGDVGGGGVLAAGGLRLAAADAELAWDWWPTEPLVLGRSPRAGGDAPAFAISRASARVLGSGHPWVLRDADSGDASRYRPGALVRLAPIDGGDAGLALIDGEGERVARRWSVPGERGQRGGSGGSGGNASIETRVAQALDRRASLLAGDAGTNAFRLVHGEADGLPGLAIDRLGDVLRVLVHGRCALALCEAAREAALRGLRERTGVEAAAIEVVHLRRPSGSRARLVCARCVAGKLELDAHGRLEVRERGLRFAVDPGLADPTRSTPGVGLFMDQRENRARVALLARQTPGEGAGRWLNLFAHTGAFSVALLAAGASEVVSVDLSARYLRWLDHNLGRNRDLGVDPGHHMGVRRDGRRFLDELEPGERFDGIVLDPPTAAAAGRRYWSIRKDLEPLIEKSLEHLAAGGWLLVARNDRAAGGPSLRDAVAGAAARRGVRIARLEPAPPGSDFPSLRGFPEGDPFRAVLVQREGGA